MSSICYDGTGSLTLQGSGSSASWSGHLVCAPFAMSGCAAVTQSFTSISASLVNGVLSGQGSGTLAGCGSSYPVTFTITATRP